MKTGSRLTGATTWNFYGDIAGYLMNLKENTEQVIQTYQSTTRERGGCGCFMTGCAITAGLFLLLCVGSYFVTMHTSIPLALIERAIESEGDVEIEGLRGSINSGFEIDSLKFAPEDTKTRVDEEGNELRNELRGLKFKFNGFFDLARSKRLIIQEMSVDSAKIYADWREDEDIEIPGSVNSEEVTDEVAKSLEELREELESGDADELREIRVDLISGRNIEIIDPVSNESLNFEQIEFKKFQMLDGRVVRLGDLTIRSDQLDIETQPSTRFDEEDVAWNLTGEIKPKALKKLKAPLAFDGDFAITPDNKHLLLIDLANGQIKLTDPHKSKRTIALNGFSHGEFFELDSPLVPSDWNIVMNIRAAKVEVPVDEPKEDAEEADDSDDENDEAEESKQDRRETKFMKTEIVSIDPGAHFTMGQTKFLIQTDEFQFGPGESMRPLFVKAIGQWNGQEITAKLQMRGNAPFYSINLEAAGMDSKEIWSQLFFQSPFEELTDEQKQAVSKSMNARLVGESEPVDF